MDPDANEMACEMHNIWHIIDDPKTAEGLMPRNYPIGCKRPVIDTDHYKTFNQEIVTLVDLRQGGTRRSPRRGWQLTKAIGGVDALIVTGFDVMTGALERIHPRKRRKVHKRRMARGSGRPIQAYKYTASPICLPLQAPAARAEQHDGLYRTTRRLIPDCIRHLEDNQVRAIEPEEKPWILDISTNSSKSMFTAPSCNSWYPRPTFWEAENLMP